MEQSSEFDPTKESKSAVLVSIIVILTIFLLLLIVFSLVKRNSFEYCQISESNDCDNEVTEIIGTINDTYAYADAGYRFTPNSNYIKTRNAIYVKNLSFIGNNLKFSGEKEYLNHSIPFGSQIIVLGKGLNTDKHRCTDKDYANKNPNICKKDGFRLLISPDIIYTTSNKVSQYSIIGKFSDFDKINIDCPEKARLCGLEAENSCFEIMLEDRICKNIQNTSNMFLVNGTTSSLNSALSPSQFFQVTSISYSGAPVDREISSLLDKYYTNVNKKFSVYDENGTKTAVVDLEDKTTFNDLSDYFVTNNGAYYFESNKLYFYDFITKSKHLVSDLQNYFQNKTILTSTLPSGDRNELILLTTEMLSSKPFDIYLLRNYKYTFLHLNLKDFEEDKKTIEPKQLYSSEYEGFLNLLSYDFKNKKAMVYFTPDIDQKSACRGGYYKQINVDTKKVLEISQIFTDYNKYCYDPIYKRLFNSENGNTLIFAQDFNPNITGQKVKKLEVYVIENDLVTKKVYLSDDKTLNEPAIRITDKKDNSLIITNTLGEDILYSFNLNNSDFIPENFSPLFKRSISKDCMDNSDCETEDIKKEVPNFLYNSNPIFYNDTFVFFMQSSGASMIPYKLNIENNSSIQLATFSKSVREQIVGDKLYFIDWDY